MTDDNRDVFGGAARAGDYIEEDTTTVAPHLGRRTKNETPADGLPTFPPIPSSPLRPEGAPVRLEPLVAAVPPAPKAPAEAPVERSRDESLSVLFHGAASGLTSTSTAPTKSTKGLRGLLRLAPSPAELAEHEHKARCLANETTIRQATWTRHVRILLANKKGGTGKTPLSILLGGVIAAIKGGSVAIWEVSDDPGALNFRAEGNPTLGLGELVRDVDTITSAGQLAGYGVPQTSFATVFGTVGSRAALAGEDVVKVSDKIGEFYGIEVMDSGNVPTSPAFQGAVSVADILVIPVMNSGDSVLQAIEVLEELRNGSEHARVLAANAIAVRLKDGRPESPAVAEEVARLLHDAGVTQLHEVPYDAHIAERGQLTVGKLTPATRDALAAAAAGVVRSLQTIVSTKR
ncbi:MinD-like ATPase involved in chromosome partitioning or flagellar assembly [Frondihabitans sp. PhB188]|nr:MinD-like ATPase involved in chromosome partitioning or flagellar assembly [Frondihabitans sp. PhB188]